MKSKHIFSISLNPRQKTMIVITLAVAAVVLVLEQWTFPAYDRWRQQASALRAKTAVHARLSMNISIKDRVDNQFAMIPEDAFRSGSDEITLAEFLKHLETAAGNLLVKVEPAPVDDEGLYATYRVRLLLSGRLQDIVRFADELTGGGHVVGVESFALRAIPGRNMCDSTFVLRMVRLSPAFSSKPRPATKPASVELPDRSVAGNNH